MMFKMSYQCYFSLPVNISKTSAFNIFSPSLSITEQFSSLSYIIYHISSANLWSMITLALSITSHFLFFFFSKATIFSLLNVSQVLEESVVFMRGLFHWIRFTTSGTHFVDVLHLPTGTHWFGLTTCIRSPD